MNLQKISKSTNDDLSDLNYARKCICIEKEAFKIKVQLHHLEDDIFSLTCFKWKSMGKGDFTNFF